jgi:hypothetical protein
VKAAGSDGVPVFDLVLHGRFNREIRSGYARKVHLLWDAVSYVIQ